MAGGGDSGEGRSGLVKGHPVKGKGNDGYIKTNPLEGLGDGWRYGVLVWMDGVGTEPIPVEPCPRLRVN